MFLTRRWIPPAPLASSPRRPARSGPPSRARFAPAPATLSTVCCSTGRAASPRRVRQQFPSLRDHITLAPFMPPTSARRRALAGPLGGGVEYAINPHWSVRGEYRYSDFGSLAISPAASSIGVVFAADRHLDQDQVQVGFSYKFGDWVAPVPVAAKY